MKTEQKTKHTSGPWETGCLMTQVEVHPAGWNVPMIIADCHPTKGYCPTDEAERCANARLIASAPDLLAALQAAVSYLETNRPNGKISEIFSQLNEYENTVMKPARQAIATATGEEKP